MPGSVVVVVVIAATAMAAGLAGLGRADCYAKGADSRAGPAQWTDPRRLHRGRGRSLPRGIARSLLRGAASACRLGPLSQRGHEGFRHAPHHPVRSLLLDGDDHARMTAVGRQVEREVAVHVGDVHIGATGQKELRDVLVATVCGHGERRPAPLIADVDVRAARQKGGDTLHGAVGGGFDEFGVGLEESEEEEGRKGIFAQKHGGGVRGGGVRASRRGEIRK